MLALVTLRRVGRWSRDWYRTRPDRPPVDAPADEVRRRYERLRWGVFAGTTFGYGVFYVCRLALSVAKKPLIDAGILDAEELGLIGSALLFTYAIGKFANGLIADRSHIGRLMATGLAVSALTNLAAGLQASFLVFVVLWAANGWAQSTGAAPSVVALSHWFSNRERGTRYGIWSVAHGLGEGFTFVATAAVVAAFGWRWGFFCSGALGLLAAVAILRLVADRPQSYGLPAVAEFKNDHAPLPEAHSSVGALQLEVLQNPAIWVLGVSAALMSVARYAINNWGIFYLQVFKGYELVDAGTVLASFPIIGMVGAASAGLVSDRVFGSRRNVPTLLFGLLQIAGLAAFLRIPAGHMLWDAVALAVFGFALNGLLVFLGGLTAVDIAPKRAAGAAMGFIGLWSYVGAAIQDWLSGALIEHGHRHAGAALAYDFSTVTNVWLGAAIAAVVLSLTIWNVKARD
ncbi:MAG: MFS transporter [Deltaproteobacteria bacterium]|nr:MFS transporter [Deltaproteobacteria bacterium]